jgi:hypothetical protein
LRSDSAPVNGPTKGTRDAVNIGFDALDVGVPT